MSTRFPIDGAKDALWAVTAVPAPDCERLEHDLDVDVAIVGAGFTGLNAALTLAKAGTSVAVLEGAYLGYGASGRAGGQVNLGLNLGPKALAARFGDAVGERLASTLARVPDMVFERIRQYGLDCDAVQNGWVQGAATDNHVRMQENLAQEYEPFGGGFQTLTKDEVRTRSGAHGYKGGLFCPSAGSLHPLSYTRELARVAMEHGARLFENARVTGLNKMPNRWDVECSGARVRANMVLVCTNAYSDGLIPGLKETIVPVRSVLMASEPLSSELRAKVMPNEVTFVDKRRIILYMRYDRDGRLCAGDHGPMRDSFALSDYIAVKERVVATFPELAETRWDYHWGGRIAVTRGGLPSLNVIDDGLVAGMGYNGRGVGMGSVMGQILARYVLGEDPTDLPFPITSPKRYPFHRFHALGVSAAIKWHGLRDKWEMG